MSRGRNWLSICITLVIVAWSGRDVIAAQPESCNANFTGQANGAFEAKRDVPDENYKLCNYQITVDRNQRVSLKFVGEPNYRTKHFFVLFEGSDCLAQKSFACCFGYQQEFVSRGKDLTALYVSSPTGPSRFDVEYTAVPSSESEPTIVDEIMEVGSQLFAPCGADLSDASGNLAITSFLTRDSMAVFCVWRIKASRNRQITLDINTFNTTNEQHALWVMDGPNCSSPIVLHYSEQTQNTRTQVQSTSGYLVVIYLGVFGVDENSFKATYRTGLPVVPAEPVQQPPAQADAQQPPAPADEDEDDDDLFLEPEPEEGGNEEQPPAQANTQPPPAQADEDADDDDLFLQPEPEEGANGEQPPAAVEPAVSVKEKQCGKRYSGQTHGEFVASHTLPPDEYQLCNYAIVVDTDSRVHVAFQKAADLMYGYIMLFNGPDCLSTRSFSYPIDKLSEFTSLKNYFTLLYVSTKGNGGDIKTTFNAVPASKNQPTPVINYDEGVQDVFGDCGGELTGVWGNLNLTNFIDDTRTMAFCIWRITAPEDVTLQLEVIKFNPTVKLAALWVLDGSDCGAPIVLHKSSTNNNPVNKVNSSTGQLVVIYQGIDNVSLDSFLAIFSAGYRTMNSVAVCLLIVLSTLSLWN